MTDPDGGPEQRIAAARRALRDNASPRDVLESLEDLEDETLAPAVAAELALTRATCLYRDGLKHEALGILYESLRPRPGAEPIPAKTSSRIWREIATVHRWSGDVMLAWPATFRSLSDAAHDAAARHDEAMAILDAGRICYEAGAGKEAANLLQRGLRHGDGSLDGLETRRAEIVLLQSLVMAGEIEEAERVAQAWNGDGATARLKFLLCIERARIAIARGNNGAAAEQLAAAPWSYGKAELGGAQEYEAIELEYARAELAIAEGKAEDAAGALDSLIPEFSRRGLGPREIDAMRLQAKAYDALGLKAEASGRLFQAFRIARTKGLSLHADAIRTDIVAHDAGGAQLHLATGADDRVGARFVQMESAGEGGTAKVRRAFDLELGIDVALKRLKTGDGYDWEAVERALKNVEKEVKALSGIRHMGVARVLGVLTGGDRAYYLAVEYVPGMTLRARMRGGIAPAEAAGILYRVSQALTAVHAKGKTYCDLKPENVMLRDGREPVLIDFGAAVAQKEFPHEATKGYAPPEQDGAVLAAPTMDVYAFGVMAYEIFCKALPERLKTGYFGSNERALKDAMRAAGAPELLAEFAVDALAVEPGERPAGFARLRALRP
jgi:tRNA A-37 threonylcarbamoyl transferase component Bud32